MLIPAIKSDITSGWKTPIMSKAVRDVSEEREAKGGELYKESIIIIAGGRITKVLRHTL